jgi:hypothetical protein
MKPIRALGRHLKSYHPTLLHPQFSAPKTFLPAYPADTSQQQRHASPVDALTGTISATLRAHPVRIRCCYP